MYSSATMSTPRSQMVESEKRLHTQVLVLSILAMVVAPVGYWLGIVMAFQAWGWTQPTFWQFVFICTFLSAIMMAYVDLEKFQLMSLRKARLFYVLHGFILPIAFMLLGAAIRLA